MNRLEAGPLDALRAANDPLRRVVLENGLVCLIKPDSSAPVVSVQIWVGSGSIHESPWLGAGLSHYMEHMIFKGTTTRGVAEITRAIDDAGGDINAYTSHDRTVFYADLPSRNWRVGVDVLADAVMNASLPEEEWQREKEVILREFAMGRDSPERELSHLLWSTAYRVHPYRFPVIGYEDIFRTMTREELLAYYRQHYVPDNMIAVVVGDIDPDEVEAHLRQVFSGFARRARPQDPLPAEPPQVAPREARQIAKVELARLAMAWHTVPLDHPDAAALDLLASVVGQGRSSRLEARLKERERIVHSIGAWSFTPRDTGLFAITAVFDPDREAEVRRALDEEIASWVERGFGDEEVAKARRNLLVDELDDLQTMSGQAAAYASGEFYTGNPRFVEVYLSRLEAVTAEQIREVARRYLESGRRTTVVLSPKVESVARSEPRRPELSIHRVELPNGIPLIVREDRRLPFVHAVAAFGGGLLSESAENAGITDLTANLLTRGTARRSAAEIAAHIEQLGASLEAFSGRNSFGLSAMMLSEDAEAVLGLMAECLLEPSFDPAEFEKQRDLQLAAIRRKREQPMSVAQDELRALLFPNHPYRFTTEGTEESVDALSRDAVVAHYQRLVNRSNVVLALFGDITVERARSLASRFFDPMPEGQRPALSCKAAPPVLPARSERREPRQQAIVLLGYPGINFFDPRVDALNVLQKALSGLSSDLGIEIREKRGLVYFVGAFGLTALDPGFFALYAGTRDDAIAEVESLMREQVARIVREGLRPDEFERARAQLAAAASMSLQNNGELAMSCALNELYGLGYRYSLELEQRLLQLTPEDVRRLAAELLREDRCAVAVVRPADQAPSDEATEVDDESDEP
ncbi:MAG: insulinase family protein [Kiritimatiellae bacterium]|nr:insulinase family protein [Kiritimatiellia bacterium]MDW8458856.1 pitrilysin family protein [Verrucomicrobiota bacterium]